MFGLLDNIRLGSRLAFFRSTAGLRCHASLGQLLAVLGLIWLLVLAAGYAEAGPGARVSIWGLTAEAARSYFWIGCIAVIVFLDRRSPDFILLCTAAACATLPIWVAWLIAYQVWYTVDPESYDGYADQAWWIIFVWHVVAFWRALRSVYRTTSARALMLGLAYAGLVYANTLVIPEQPLFRARARYAQQPQVNIETTYYEQAGLVERMLAGFEAGRPGVVDLFFLDFAGYAQEAVFMREAQQVRDLFDRLLGTAGRSGMLINHLDTVSEIPLANRHNLERMISGIAKLMDLEEDVLFVFITSHGAEDASVLVDFAPLGLNDLTASDLRSMLETAGIRWRVIVVSACFAGGFIEHLAAPGTLLITAAAADRTSFGCGHGRDWTYFGEAFFNDSMLRSGSFVDAFERAKAIIERREHAEGIKSSLPQIWIGGEVEAQLERWRADLDAQRASGGAAQDNPLM